MLKQLLVEEAERQGMTSTELAKRARAIGYFTPSKINRGSIGCAVLKRCLKVLGCDVVIVRAGRRGK